MKKKLTIISSLFLLSISLILGIGIGAIQKEEHHTSSLANSSEVSKRTALNIESELKVEVGEVIEFGDKFKLYVTEEDKNQLTYTIENEEIIYLTRNKYKLIGLKAGSSKVTISSDKYFTEFNVTVKERNLCEDGDFQAAKFDVPQEDKTWKNMDEEKFGWRLYTGKSAVAPDQIVEIQSIDGNNAIHYKHTSATQYSSLYKSFDVGPGQYYVTAKMKGENILKDTYVRVNQGNKMGISQTTKVKGTFDWTTFESPVVTVIGKEKLKLELYFALNEGEVWFDDLEIHRVHTPDYASFVITNPVILLEPGQSEDINPEMYPKSQIDFEFSFTSEDTSIATVDKTGKVTAIKNGQTVIKVTDNKYGLSKKVNVYIAKENGISGSFNDKNVYQVMEDSINELLVSVSGSENYRVYKYSEALYGDYYIKNNKIYYSPKADYYNLDKINDKFSVVVFDKDKGFNVVNLEINIKGIADAPQYIDFWHTTDKNGKLEWSKGGSSDYQSHGLKGGGYLQILCNDIEALYPEFYRKNMIIENENKETIVNEKQYRAQKEKLYNNVIATATNGEFSLKSANGGSVEILNNGMVQEIEDRYYPAQGKVIHGVLYNYIPKDDFYGYDHFDLKIKNGEKELIVNCTVYVAPAVEDFKFDTIDLSGTYLLSNDEWLAEVAEGYKNGDEVITTWVDFYKSQYSVHVPSGSPEAARTPMEQLAILYKITGDKEYFDKCWAEMLPIIKDEAFSGDGTRRNSWGEDSNGFLDAAMVTYSVAFTYNYIKDQLTPSQKEMVMKALYEEGFYYFENIKNPNVLLHGNNHNLLVCGNLAIAALSAMSYEGTIEVMTRDHGAQTVNVQQMAAKTVSTAFKFLQVGLVHYSEAGGFPEGPAYSIYAHRNMVALLATLRNLYGETDGKINSFGLSDIKGIMNYINYPLYTSTPNYESFYYTEAEYSNNQPALLWYTRIDPNNYNAAMLSKLAHENEQYNIQSLLYYKPGLFDKVDPSNIEKLDFLLEDHEIATFRSEFGNEMGIFTGLKGVDSHSGVFTHKNLDSGTFELYALGERFIGNYSNETYNVVVPDGYWDYDYQRWTYYKKNVQGQNTLVFNPEQNPVIMQDPYEKAPITRFESNKSSGLSIIDLSRVYKKDALSVQRGLKLYNNRQNVLIQDEFKLRDYSTMYWSAHTEARIDIINDKTVRLTLNGKSVYAVITSELGKWDAMPATALPGTIGNFCNLDNEGVNKLIIKLEDVIEGTLCVKFVASLEQIDEILTEEVVALKDWTLDLEAPKADAMVQNIELDTQFGNKYKYQFNPNTYDYVVKLAYGITEVPDFKVTYDESKYDVTIVKSPIFNNLSKVIVKNKATGQEKAYRFKFIVDTITKGYEDYKVLDIANIKGSAGVDKLIDGNIKSSFTSNKKEEIVLELNQISKITNVLIRFNGGVINTYYFDIYYSTDGESYKSCYNAGQSTNNMGDEVYTIGNIEAKYIKFVFNGEIKSNKLSLAEIKLMNNGSSPITPGESDNGNGGSNLGLILGIVGGVVALAAIATVTTVVLVRRRRK